MIFRAPQNGMFASILLFPGSLLSPGNNGLKLKAKAVSPVNVLCQHITNHVMQNTVILVIGQLCSRINPATAR